MYPVLTTPSIAAMVVLWIIHQSVCTVGYMDSRILKGNTSNASVHLLHSLQYSMVPSTTYLACVRNALEVRSLRT